MKVTRADFHGTYETARGTAQLIAGLGWVVVAIGGVVALMGLASMQAAGPFAMLGVAIGILIAVVGLLQVAAGQGVRAAVDAADYARQSFKLQIAQAEGLEEIDLQKPYRGPEGAAAEELARGPTVVEEGTYKGRRWRRLENGTFEGELMGGRFKEFANLEEFQRYIS